MQFNLCYLIHKNLILLCPPDEMTPSLFKKKKKPSSYLIIINTLKSILSEMVGWHQPLNGREFEQASGDGEGQGSLACCSPWGHKELDMTE